MSEEDFMFSEEFDEFLNDCYNSLEQYMDKPFEAYVLSADDRASAIKQCTFFIQNTKDQIQEIEAHLLKLQAGDYHKLAEEDH